MVEDGFALTQIWRYPVKSVGGERLDAVDVAAGGIAGDRAWAVFDDQKQEITWAGAAHALMSVQARQAGSEAELEFADGRRARTDEAGVHEALSRAVSRPVHLVRHRPLMPDAPVHLLTTASLRAITAALPDTDVVVERFRPNLVLDVTGEGLPELAWPGRSLRIGEITLRVTDPCVRCVMVNQATPRSPADRAVLRWIAREHRNQFGVYASVESAGRVQVGDTAELLG